MFMTETWVVSERWRTIGTASTTSIPAKQNMTNTRNVSERDLISSPASDRSIAANYNIRHPVNILSSNKQWMET